MSTDTSDTSAEGEIQLNQRTLEAIIQGVTAKLQEAAKPTEASPGPSTGEYGLVHTASGVQVAPRRVYPAQYTKATGRRWHRAQTWVSKLLTGCSWPQALCSSDYKDYGGPKLRAGGLLASSSTGCNSQANGWQGAAGTRYVPRVVNVTASKWQATVYSSNQAPRLVLLHPQPGSKGCEIKKGIGSLAWLAQYRHWQGTSCQGRKEAGQLACRTSEPQMSILGTKCKGPRSQTSMLEAHNPPHFPPPPPPPQTHPYTFIRHSIHTHVMHTHADTNTHTQLTNSCPCSHTHMCTHTRHTHPHTLTCNHRDTHMHPFTHSHTLSSMPPPLPTLLLGFIHTDRWCQICPPGCYTFVLWLSQQVSLAGYCPHASW